MDGVVNITELYEKIVGKKNSSALKIYIIHFNTMR